MERGYWSLREITKMTKTQKALKSQLIPAKIILNGKGKSIPVNLKMKLIALSKI
jgi:hypothetical protein